MKKVYLRLAKFIILFIIITEIISRIAIDPLYFDSINTYDLDNNKNIYADYFKSKHTEHVDYLFIGRSRVPASINPKIFMQKDPGSIAVVAGRGYMTAGIHIQALENRLKQYPDYLKGAKVIIGYPGSSIYTDLYSDDRLKVYEPEFYSNAKPMPHLMLPHIHWGNLMEYLQISENKTKVKSEMVMLYLSSAARCQRYLKEKLKEKLRVLNESFSKKDKETLTNEGGIRTDGLDEVRKRAIVAAGYDKQIVEESPTLTYQAMDNSSLAYLNNLVVKNGGSLFLYEIPLHSAQANIYSSQKAKKDKDIFEGWLEKNNITIIDNNGFNFSDSDFPDIWHLSINRRDEFSTFLFNRIYERE